MLTDMENPERDASCDSSQTRRRGKSGKSPKTSQSNSDSAPAEETGAVAEPRLSSLDVLLSILQSDLGEIRDFGGVVRFFSDPNGLIIQLPNVAICQTHKMIHSGEICPHC